MQSLTLSLLLSDPSVASALTLMCAVGGEEASVEMLGFSTGLTSAQFQMVALVGLSVVLVMVAFMTVLVAPGGPARTPAAPLSSPETASGQEQEHEQEQEWTVGDRS